MKATNIKTVKRGDAWFVTAEIEAIPYQHRFDDKPDDLDVFLACKSFEINYAGLNDSEKEPVIVKPHHSEI